MKFFLFYRRYGQVLEVYPELKRMRTCGFRLNHTRPQGYSAGVSISFFVQVAAEGRTGGCEKKRGQGASFSTRGKCNLEARKCNFQHSGHQKECRL